MQLTVSPFIARLLGFIGLCSVIVAVLADRFAPAGPVLMGVGWADWAFVFMSIVAIVNFATTSRGDGEKPARSAFGRLLQGGLWFLAAACLGAVLVFKERAPPFGIDGDLFAIACCVTLGVSVVLLLLLPAGRGKAV